MTTIYQEPEKFGLTTIGEVEMSSGIYEFDLFVIWRDSNGRFLWAQDAGNSDPSPFEFFYLSDLKSGSNHEAARAMQETMRDRPWAEHAVGDALDLIARVMALR